MENIQDLNKFEIFLAKFNTKPCKEKVDDIVSTNDIYIVLDIEH